MKKLQKHVENICTFTKRNKLNEAVDIIVSCNDILYDKVYVFANQDDEHQLICTYNVEYSEDFVENVQDTISLHRKKQSNTLYTINALNTLIKSLNDGQLDSSYRINWGDYRNCVLLTKGPELKRVNTKLHKIIEL